MDYVLTTFDELVYGQLESTASNLQKTSEYIQFLDKHFPECNHITIGIFKESGNGLKLIRRKELCCLHPEVTQFAEQQLQLFEEYHFSKIHPNCFAQLNIEPGNVKRIVAKKHKRSVSYSFIESSRWDRLSENNLRYFYYCGIIKQEKERVIHAIKSKAHQINSRNELELFIHKNQQSINSLCHRLLNRLSFNKKYDGCRIRNEYSAHDIFNLIYHYLEKILRFIERNYRPYLGNDLMIPYRSCLLDESGITEKSKLLQAALQQSDLDPELKSIILVPLEKVCDLNPLNRITYSELHYFNRLVNKLNTEFQRNNQISEQRMVSMLVQLNFNSPDILPYLTTHYSDAINCVSDIDTKLNNLYRIQKNINQLQSCGHCALNPSDPDLKTQLSNWVDEEIHFLKLTNHFEQVCAALTNCTQIQSARKLSTNLSVAEIALLFRVMNDAGLFETDNNTELFSFIADHLKSKQQSAISAQSVKQRYYNPDDFAVKSLINQFKILLRSLERL